MNKERFEPDAATLISDDELLDALGRGERPSKDDDPLALAFALWREDIDGPAIRAPAPATARARKAKPGNKFRWGIISGVVAALLGGGLTVAAASTAEPGGPLWGVAERVFPQRAQSKSMATAQLALADARTAISEQKLDVAEQKVKEAETLIGKVTSLVDQQVLQAELVQVRDLLATARATLGTVVPTPSPSPGLPGLPGVPGLPVPTPAPTGGDVPLPTPTPTPSPAKTGLLPLPTISLPLPSIKLPL